MRDPSCVGALIRNEQGRVFVQRRSVTRRVLPGTWDIVGGHVEAGETLEAALAREINEETGWRLRRIGPQIADWEWQHDGVVRRELDFLVEVDGNVTAPRLEAGKHDAYAWIGFDNLDLVMDGRTDTDQRLRDIVARAIGAVNGIIVPESIMDEDLQQMSRERLIDEIKKLRQGIRAHRDSTRHELCWHHPALWGLLPEKTDPLPVVPDWPQFLEGCLKYRRSLDEQLPDAPRTREPYRRER